MNNIDEAKKRIPASYRSKHLGHHTLEFIQRRLKQEHCPNTRMNKIMIKKHSNRLRAWVKILNNRNAVYLVCCHPTINSQMGVICARFNRVSSVQFGSATVWRSFIAMRGLLLSLGLPGRLQLVLVRGDVEWWSASVRNAAFKRFCVRSYSSLFKAEHWHKKGQRWRWHAATCSSTQFPNFSQSNCEWPWLLQQAKIKCKYANWNSMQHFLFALAVTVNEIFCCQNKHDLDFHL